MAPQPLEKTMKTYFIPFEGKEYPLVQTADWRFFVPLRPIYERLGMPWSAQSKTLFSRYNVFWLEDQLVEQRDGSFVVMTCIPLIRLGWWWRSRQGPRGPQASEFRAGMTAIADEFLRAFDFALSGILSGNDPNSPAVPFGKDLLIAELQFKLAEKTAVKQRNRMPRVAITVEEVARWRQMKAQGLNYQDIAAEVGRSVGTVRRSILGEG
ncbi:MAG: hypothetical protein ACRDBL_08955 [Rhabdaerophilum sp.]